jgi:hypothetical protein
VTLSGLLGQVGAQRACSRAPGGVRRLGLGRDSRRRASDERVFVEGERDTYLHRVAFQMLAGAVLDPVWSRQLILKTARSYWSTARFIG